MGAPKISDGITSKSEASACLGAKFCKGSRAYDRLLRKLSVDSVAGNVGTSLVLPFANFHWTTAPGRERHFGQAPESSRWLVCCCQ